MPDEQTESIEGNIEEHRPSDTVMDASVASLKEQEPSDTVMDASLASKDADVAGVTPATSPTGSLSIRARPAPMRKRTHRSSSFKPAYLILAVAVLLVGVLSIVLFQGAAGLLAQVPGAFSQNSAQTTPIVPTPQGTLDLRPVFPTPGGGQGGQQSSLPPDYAQPTVAATPTTSATAEPSPTTVQGGSFTLQFASVPSRVSNNTNVQVSVLSSEPGVTVRLYVTYDVAPYSFNSGAIADDIGLAMLNWRVSVVNNTRTNQTVARLTVTAQDQNGQQASTQTITVQITTFGGG